MSEAPHRKPERYAAFHSGPPAPHEANPIQRSWDKAESIRELLKQYPQRCIKPGESMEQAHRYAGMVDLAATIMDRFWPNDGEEE